MAAATRRDNRRELPACDAAAVPRLSVVVARAANALRHMLGVPDYERYVEHVRLRHPDTVPLAHDAFLRDALARRYDRPGNRCC